MDAKIEALKRLNAQGLSDAEIGRHPEIRLTETGVRYWRRKLGMKKPSKKYTVPRGDVSKLVAEERKQASLMARIRLLTRENKLLVQQANLWEQVKQVIEGTVRALAPVKFPKRKANGKTSSPETFCVVLTDIHYGERVSFKATNGFNHYSTGVAVARLEDYSDRIRDFVRTKLRGLNLHRCVVFILGDVVSGLIHDELVKTNQVGIISQSVEVAHYVAQFLREIASEFPEVHVVCNYGNHGRELQKREAKGQKESFDRLVYLLLKKELSGQKNLSWDIPEGPYSITEIEGHWFLSQHGNHAIGPSPFGIPWYSIVRMAMKIAALYITKGVIVSNVVMGHFHQRAAVPWGARRKVLISASMKGADEYSTGNLGAGDEASQLIFGVTKKIGVTWEWPIALQGAGEKPRRYSLYAE